jgi:type I restriction enzyme R subunit
LNKLAHEYFPGKYQSDFAMQVTSDVPEAQQATINFANNKLNGHTNFLPDYDSSKTRVCVTVGMMTTGYDCEDILNLCLCRPIFSPTDFVQIKGRGTRICDFRYEEQSISKKDLRFKMFDFFANCQYFEQEYDYDQIIPLPKVQDNLNDSIDPNDIYDADAENTTSKA